MPVALFICPHCNQHAEVSVTSVTRSRPCPHCGEPVVLQVSAKEKGTRRALLVASGEVPTLPVQAPVVAGPVYEPQPLEGDPLERMKLDPEIKLFRRRFIAGICALAALILLIVLFQGIGGSLIQSIASNSPQPVTTTGSARATAHPVLVNSVGMRRGPPADSSSATTKLVFEPPTKSQKADAVTPTAEPLPPPLKAIAAAPPREPEVVKSVEALENVNSNSKKVTLAMSDPRLQAAAALERFLTANNIDAMLATVADRSKVEPKIRSYITTHPLVPLDYQSLTISNGAGPTGARSIVVTLKDGSTRDAVVIREDGRAVVDWPSFVAWSDMEWAQFMQKKPHDPVLFRVLAASDQRFDHAFADEKKFVCLKLSNPRNPAARPLFAYAERISNAGQELDFLMRQSEGKPTKLTLQLKYPIADDSQDQVLIEDLLANGWTVPKDKSTASK